MDWFWIVLIGHLLTAVGFVLSKALLSDAFSNARVFTFYVGLLGLLAVGLIPFGFEIPALGTIIFNLVAGGLFSAAILYFSLALQGAESSRVVPFVGALIPVFTLVFELLFLDGSFTPTQLWAFAILVIGSFVITVEYKTVEGEKRGKTPFTIWMYGLMAAILFAVSYGMTAVAFTDQPFLSAFIWMRIGGFFGVVGFLFYPLHRAGIIKAAPIFFTKTGLLYLSTQALAGAGFVFINYALTLASVSIVNALQGVQYVFLLGIAAIGSLKYPNLLKENLGRSSLMVKIVGLLIISFGIYLVAQGAVSA